MHRLVSENLFGLTNELKNKLFAILFLNKVDYVLSNIVIVYSVHRCFPSKDPVEEFFKDHLSQLFEFTPYALWKAILGKWINVVATFLWSYMELFVMIISFGISTRFKQINDDLKRLKGEVYFINLFQKNIFHVFI